MKKVSIFILTVVFLGCVGTSFATSPMPEEAKPGKTAPVCIIQIGYMPDREQGIPGKETSSTLVFEVSDSKRDVLEKVTKHISDKLNEGNVAEFRLECKFPEK